MKELVNNMLAEIEVNISEIDLYGYDIVETFLSIVRRLQAVLNDLKTKLQIHSFYKTLNPQLHSRSATYIKRNGLLIRKITIKSSRPFQCAYHPLTP